MKLSRRHLLRTATALPVVSLAGCSTLPGSAPTPTRTPSYDHLRTTPIYRGDDIGLRVPDRLPTVETPTSAALIVIHANPAMDANQAVTWLTEGRAVALLGEEAQATWTDWTGSDAYREAFDSRGRSRGAPEPQLIVAADAGPTAATYRYTWSDRPSNAQLLAALDEAVAEIDTAPPQ